MSLKDNSEPFLAMVTLPSLFRIVSSIRLTSKRVWLLAGAVPLLLLFSFFTPSSPDPTTSPEIGFASISPNGEAGGIVVPASCASNLHDDPWYGRLAQAVMPVAHAITDRGSAVGIQNLAYG
jgi:hypothetical protein